MYRVSFGGFDRGGKSDPRTAMQRHHDRNVRYCTLGADNVHRRVHMTPSHGQVKAAIRPAGKAERFRLRDDDGALMPAVLAEWGERIVQVQKALPIQ